MYTRTITVMPSDVSCDGIIKLRSLLDYFQDTAALAVEPIEGTTTELYSRGLAWVLIKYEIDFTGDWPGLDQSFPLSTYHDPFHGYHTLRVFDTPFCSAKTSWLLADIRTGHTVKPVAHIPNMAEGVYKHIPPNFNDIPCELSGSHASVHHHAVTYHDLDYWK